jgi:hypothetical protein
MSSLNNLYMNKPTVGRIVLFKNTQGVVFPAVIVHVGIPDDENSWVNIRVFTNSTDFPWETSVTKNTMTDGQADRSWEWPPRA